MSIQGGTITAAVPGANQRTADSRISALIGHGVAIAGKVALATVIDLYSLKDAEALGINAAYDTANNVAVWYNIKEFYRMAGSGVNLKIMLVDNTVTTGTLGIKMVDMLNDAGSIYAKKLLLAGQGKIYQLGVMFNPGVGYAGTALNGMDSDVYNSLAAAVALYAWADAHYVPCNILLEGYNLTASGAASVDLRALTGPLKANYVSLVIGQDYDYCETLNAIGKKHAAIGTALGSVAISRISQNIGDAEDPDLNLTNASTGDWVTPGLSGHVKCVDKIDDLDIYDSKAYIFGVNINGIDGARWNNDYTCAPIEIDSAGNQSINSISDGRTMDEVRRRLRALFIPKLRTTQKINPTTGKLSSGTIEYFNGLGDGMFNQMASEGDIAGGQTSVDPNSNLSQIPRILTVGFGYVKNGQIDQINGKVTIQQKI